MSTPAYWKKATTALKKKDPVLKAIIEGYGGEMLTLRGEPFFTLTRAIVGQQISVKAADSVWKKLQAAVEQKVTPQAIANADATALRNAGLSARKVLYLHSLANHFLENKKLIKRWPDMDDDAIIKELVTIKGIGRWTAEMFLMFGLGRPDVFPIDDLGLIKGIQRHYNKGKELPLEKIKAIGENWRPYRSVGTWYMWRALDPLPVAY